MLVPGIRIVRGPDWKWGDQDGGEGHVGTVCEIGQSGLVGSPDKTVVVQWDSGTRTNYRIGYLGKYDLYVIDNAQIGVKHPNIVCDGCKSQGINGMRYKCLACYDYDLCYMCYHRDVHDVTHTFKRFDSATAVGTELPTRENGRKGELKGIFVGAKVVRGFDWEWGDQDGGEGKIGQVLDIRGWDNESSRSVANVNWTSGSTNVYRLGQKGHCDIKYVEFASGGPYYPDHLPVLGQMIEEEIAPIQVRVEPSNMNQLTFGVGDKVQVMVSVDELKVMQQGHGGWNPRMAEYVNKIGIVHRVTDKGDIRVQYEGCNNRWTFNPLTLIKINSFSIGDVVTVINDLEKMKILQKGHGEWIDIMQKTLGKIGKIVKIYSDGDLRIQLDGHAWTLNPECVRIVRGRAAELDNTMQASQNQRQEPSIQWRHSNDDQSDNVTDNLVRAAAQGHLDDCKKILENAPKLLVNKASGGKTALQVAAHQGHLAVVKYLLENGASVNISDYDGDTSLHYASFGNQPEVLRVLINAGSHLNCANRSGCTALHIAAHKQPSLCVEILLEAGADPNCKDLYGDTALHDAIGKDNFQVIDLLCEAAPTIDFTIRNKRGFNVLHHAALKGKKYATNKLLFRSRQLVDVKKDDGFSALHLAALNGHKDVVETLIQVGQAQIELRNNRNQSALLLAISQGHCGVIEALVTLKANINTTDEDGDNALHLILNKQSEPFTESIRYEESPEICDIYERIRLGEDMAAVENPVVIAIGCYLIRKGIDMNARNNNGQTPLMLVDEATIPLLRDYKSTTDYLENNQPSSYERSSEIAQSFDMNSYNLTNESISNFSSTLIDNENRSSTDTTTTTTTQRNSRREKLDMKLLLDDTVNKSDSKKNSETQNNDEKKQQKKPVECLVCSELSEENVTLEPCNHKPACEDCSARMKKCLKCGRYVQKRMTKDGRIIAPKNRHPSAERMRYLESKIAEIEESHSCSICMERKRNVIFLCGHGTCSRCADTLATCHMCRKPITKKIPVY